MAEILTDLPLVRCGRTIARLRKLGIPSLIGTITWRFAAEIIAVVTALSAPPVWKPRSTRTTGSQARSSRHFDEFDKLSFVEAYCRSHKIASSVFAVGDASDVPLFGAVVFAFALNATPQAQAAASTSLCYFETLLLSSESSRGWRLRSLGQLTVEQLFAAGPVSRVFEGQLSRFCRSGYATLNYVFCSLAHLSLKSVFQRVDGSSWPVA